MFIERGYAATTVAAIGEAAGYSRGIVTARFGSKERLAWEVARRAGSRWDSVLDHTGPETMNGLERIRAFIRASRDSMQENPEYRMVLERLIADAAVPMAPLHDRFRDSLIRLERRLQDTLIDGGRDGSIRADIDPRATASLVIAQLRGIGYQWFLFPHDVDPLTAHTLVEDQITTWLRADPGIDPRPATA